MPEFIAEPALSSDDAIIPRKNMLYKKAGEAPSGPCHPQSGIRRVSKTQVFGVKEQNWVRFAKPSKIHLFQVVFS
jgi:hypothetical protein